jgi:hypothetical protein
MESRPSGTGLLPPLLQPEKCEDAGGAVGVLGLSARGAAVGGGGNLGFRGLRGRLTGAGWRGAGGVESFCGELMPPVGPGVLRAGARLEGESGGPENKKGIKVESGLQLRFSEFCSARGVQVGLF